jgi:hypothetical protein
VLFGREWAHCGHIGLRLTNEVLLWGLQVPDHRSERLNFLIFYKLLSESENPPIYKYIMLKVITLPFGGFLCEYGFDGGWPSIFYIIGIDQIYFY